MIQKIKTKKIILKKIKKLFKNIEKIKKVEGQQLLKVLRDQ